MDTATVNLHKIVPTESLCRYQLLIQFFALPRARRLLALFAVLLLRHTEVVTDVREEQHHIGESDAKELHYLLYL